MPNSKPKNKRRGKIVGKPDEPAQIAPGDAARPPFTAADAAEVAKQIGVWWVDGAGDKYLVEDKKRESYATWSERKLLKLMRTLPGRKMIAQRPRENEALSETDKVLLHVMQERKVLAEFPAIAGHKAGHHAMPNGGDVIVKKGPSIVEPVEGDCSTYRELVEARMGKDQSAAFWGWLRHAYRSLLTGSPGNYDQGHAVILAGRAKSAKSFLQHYLITPMLGGRDGDPEGYLFGRTDFNAEMIGAEHLLMEDPANTTLTKDRVFFGEMIKRIVANPTARLHRKSVDGIMGQPFWRLTISVNDDPDKLRVLPLLTPDIADKLLIFSVTSAPMPMPVRTSEDKLALRMQLKKELPALAWWLLNEFELPAEMEEVNPRFGLKEYHDPELVTSLFEDTPSSELLMLIDSAVLETAEGRKYKLWELPEAGNDSTVENVWFESALVLQQLLLGEFGSVGKEPAIYESSVEKEARKLFAHAKCDRLLARLKEDQPDRVDKDRWTSGEKKGRRGWRIASR